MQDIKLIIGDKNYSTWPLRAWLTLKMAGIPFVEETIVLDQPGSKERLAEASPTGLLPVLEHRGGRIWDSLAICETLAERFPGARLWPDDPDARAQARAVAAEMHSGFAALRSELPMNVRRSGKPPAALSDLASAQIARVQQVWRDCRSRSTAAGGTLLFGRFSIADAMYAPVTVRFRSYGVALDPACAAYVRAVSDLPPMLEWCAGAMAEPWRNPKVDAR